MSDKMIPLCANMLVKLCGKDDEVLFQASIDSILPVVDKIYILDTGARDEAQPLNNLIDINPKITIIEEDPDFCSNNGFAAARNLLLERSPQDCFILWIDSDEIFVTEELQTLKEVILDSGKYEDVQTHFLHFCIGSNSLEKFEARVNIFRRSEGTHWIGKVHERIIHSIETEQESRKIFYSDLYYFHFGYVRDQSTTIFGRWQQYATLEGRNPKCIEQEFPDHRVLDHRRSSLLPYFGTYPSSLPESWVKSKMIAL